MLNNILNRFNEEVKKKFEEFEKQLKEKLDFTAIEKTLAEMLNSLGASILESLLRKQLQDEEFLEWLIEVGGRLGIRFKEYRTITVRLYNSQTITVQSPYFSRVQKKGRRRHGGYGAHLGLEVLGFVDRASGNLVSEVVKMALLCPSFQVAQVVLAERGIELDLKTVRRYCKALGQIGLSLRGKVSLDGREVLDGYTLVIGIDGGRIRERVKKRSKKKKGQKRAGFEAPWREPKLFTIYLLSSDGRVVEEFAPLHDATMGNDDEVFVLLEKYLAELELDRLARIVFCGDGGKWIWPRVQALVEKLRSESDFIYQVIDYTHAKQNLNEIVELIQLSQPSRDKIYEKWKELLWKGDINGLYQAICQMLKGKKRRQALKKWENYFHKNMSRMQYQHFKENHIPCGSGCVESAIRRVINLRLKSAGSFWTRQMAEYFLFLRSQLLSGRWKIFMSNVLRRLVMFTEDLCQIYTMQSEVKVA